MARSRVDVICRELRSKDREPLSRLLRECGAFSDDEVRVALELIDEGLAPDGDPDYRFVVAEHPSEGPQGYTCFGPTPLTDGVFDLYWIAVDPRAQGRGVGKLLLSAAESEVRASGGRMILIETASKPEYASTRAFYDGAGYSLIARIPDFYRIGDDKLIYRRLTERPTTP